jgi:hypothetical protein
MDGTTPIDQIHAQAHVPAHDPFALGEYLAQALGGAWQASAGSLHFDSATVDFHAWPDGLRLDAYASSEAGLAATERAIDEALRRRHAVGFAWRTRPSTLPGAEPLEPPVYNFPFDDDHDD